MGAQLCRRRAPPGESTTPPPREPLNQVFARCMHQMFPTDRMTTKTTLNHNNNNINSLSKSDIGGPLHVYTTNLNGWSTAVLTVPQPEEDKPVPPPRRRRRPRPGAAVSITQTQPESPPQTQKTKSEPPSKQKQPIITPVHSTTNSKKEPDMQSISINQNNENQASEENDEKKSIEEVQNKVEEKSLVTLSRNLSREDLEETAQRIKTYMKRCRSFGSFDAGQFVNDLCSGNVHLTLGVDDLHSDDEEEFLPVSGEAPFQPSSRLTVKQPPPPDSNAMELNEKNAKKENTSETKSQEEIEEKNKVSKEKKDEDSEEKNDDDEQDDLETLQKFQQYMSMAHRRPSAPPDFPDMVEFHPGSRRESLPVINDTDEMLEVVDYGFRGSFSEMSRGTPPPTPEIIDHSNLLKLLREHSENAKDNKDSPEHSLTPSLNELETAISQLLEEHSDESNECKVEEISTEKIKDNKNTINVENNTHKLKSIS